MGHYFSPFQLATSGLWITNLCKHSTYPFSYRSNPNPPDIPDNYNPVGSYKRFFNIPESWTSKDVIIHLGAVKSAFYMD